MLGRDLSHFLCAKTGVLTTDQVKNEIRGLSKRLAEISQVEISDECYVNPIMKRQDEKQICSGTSLVWVKSIELWNALCGKNIDGTERVEIIVEDSSEEVDYNDSSLSWGDLAEKTKITRKELGPLIKSSKVPYTKKQSEEVKETPFYQTQLVEYYDERTKENFEILENMEKYHEITFFPMKERIGEEGTKKNFIITSNPPAWATNVLLKSFFSPYNTDMMTHRDKKVSYTYPRIVRERNHLKIFFSPDDIEGVSQLFKVARFKEGVIFFNRGKDFG